jgi:hypothetical protein
MTGTLQQTFAPAAIAALMAVALVAAGFLGDPYSKKSPLPSIGDRPCLAGSPKLSGYQVLSQSRIQQRHITCYNHPRIEAST